MPATQPSAEVSALIARLGDTDYNVREKAQADLVNLGASIKPFLQQAATESDNDEIRQRAAAAIHLIDRNIANEPTYITLHVADETPQAVLKEICQQAHTDIHIWPDQMWTPNMGPVPKVTLNIDHLSFWTAMAAFCDQANCHPQSMANYLGITLMQGKTNGNLLGGKALNCGLVTIAALGASHMRNISYANDSTMKNDNLQLMVFADPKLKLLSYNAAPAMDTIVDDNGASMLSSVPQPMYDQNAMFEFQLQVPLAYPNNPGKKIAHLKGTLNLTIISKSELIEFDDLAAAVGSSKTAGGRTVQVKSFSVDASHNAHLDLNITNGVTAVNFNNNIFSEMRNMKITDTNGESQFINGGGGGNNQQIDWQCQFQLKAGNTAKFSWDVMTETKEMDVPFAFDDLPLPAE